MTSSSSRAGLVEAAALVLVLGLLEAFLVWCRRALIATPGTGVERTMRVALFRHLEALPVAFHDRWAGGQLLSRAMGDLGLVRRWIVFGLVMLIVSLTTVVVGIGLMLATSWLLGLVYLAGAVPVVVLGFRFREQAGDLAVAVEESVHGIRVLKAFGRGGEALEDFARQAAELRETELDKARTLSRVSLALGTIPETALAVCLGLGAWLAAHGRVSVGALVAFFATAAVVNGPVERIGQLLAMTLDARASADRFVEVMDLVPALQDPPHPVALPAPGPAGTRVELQGMRFAHGSSSGGEVLTGVDLVLEPGRTTALVGLTGSGKTTLAQLVPRLYDVTGGRVLLDGVDVRDLTLDDVRTCVSVAFEDPVLFSTTVRENVLLGTDPDAPDADQRLAEALEVAAAGFVHQLPQGVHTRVGEEGLSLSGGQRQRLALARAVAAHPRVLVLDDPLSALDVSTEAEVTSALRRLLPGTTTLVVAHRTSTVALADRVALLRDGRIASVGTHSQLLADDPHYRYVLTALDEDADMTGAAR